ncbi:imidazolonepropionase [Brachybacterium sp. Marseille-Q7125]|uniref:imidazolonepropionase n=1 Tax=Brachybacterium sp. Marseille-Q7125 TaxID=2932815 RepID=UPI001FF5FA36|nr:imidazolonepropionase [Brachybacterium sp. Marseille-Q7125]
MTSTLLTGISELWTLDPDLDEPGTAATDAQVLRDAALLITDGQVAWYGPADEAPSADDTIDLEGRAVLPGWVDSHTHLVFDGDRSGEFEARMAGQSYAAGGIQVTTDATREASDARLEQLVRERIDQAVAGGTTTLEAKTGYGLTVEDEARAARILARLREAGQVDAVTFLGAHLVPGEYRNRAEEYLELVIGPMLAAVAEHCDFIDVFCEDGAFTREQSARVLVAGREAGLGLRVHGNQISAAQDGLGLAVELGAASVDHLNHLADGDLEKLAESGTVATVLPACDLSTRAPLAPARELLDAGATVAIASNCNPGTSYTSAMSFCVTTAVLQMHLSLAEAIRAATRGGAAALGRSDLGHLGVGARADVHVLDTPHAIDLAYRPGMPLTHRVWRAGHEHL